MSRGKTMTDFDNPSWRVEVMERREVIGDPTWLDARQAGIYASLSASTIRKTCGRLELQHIRVGRPGGPILTRTEWVNAWLMKGVREPILG
jgi:hypothetical protein